MARTPQRKRFNPLAPSFKYQSGFDRAVKQRANQQLAPARQDVSHRMSDTRGAHKTRAGELQGWYGFAERAGTTANNTLNTQLQSLLGTVRGSGVEGSDALAAAIRQSQSGTDERAKALGVASPDDSGQYSDALRAYSDAGTSGLAGDMASILG